MAASAYYDSIQKMYMAFYGRPADPTGLETWAKIADKEGGMTLNVLANFVQGAEAQALYGNKSNAEVVNAAYNYLFGRDAEPAALTTWAAGVSSSADMANLLWNIMAGAAGADKVAVDSKLAAANAFTASVDTTAEILAFNGAASNAAARSFLATVKDADTLAAATAPAALAASVLATTSVGTSNVGQTFTLTTGQDNITGTSGNDTINGLAQDSVAATTDTLTAADIVNGGAGTDTLNITATAANTDVTMGAQISNIEIVNIRQTAATGTAASLDASKISGVTAVNSNLATGDIVVTNLGTGASAGITGDSTVVNGKLDFGYAAAAGTVGATATLNVSGGVKGTNSAVALNQTAVTGNVQNVVVNSTGSAANALKSLDLDGTGAAAATSLTVNAAAALDLGTGVTGFTGTAAKITVAGAAANIAATATAAEKAAVVLGTIENATVKTIDASGLTAGGISATLSTNTTINVTGGAGNDTITTGAVLATGASVDAGAGTGDTLVVGTAAHLTAATGVFYKNFEVLNNGTNSSLDVSTVAGLTNVITSVAGGGFTKLTAAQAADIKVTASLGATGTTYALASATGTADVLGLNFTNATATTVENATALTITGFETLNLTAGSGSKTLYDAAGTTQLVAGTGYDSFDFAATTDLKTVTLAGDYAAKINLDSDQAKVTTVDASNNKGGLDLALGGQTGTVTVTGTATRDVIALTAAGTGGLQNVNTGAGNDAISAAQAVIAVATINGGADVDTLTVSDTGTVTINDNNFAGVSAIEKLAFGATTGLTFSVGGYANALATANAGVLDVTAAALDTTANVTIDGTGLTAGNSLKLSLTNADAADANAISVVLSQGADNITIKQTAASAADTITINGGVAALASTAAKTIDLSGVTKAGATAVTTGAGADVIKAAVGVVATYTAGAGADTIILGAADGAAQTLKYDVANQSTTTAWDKVSNFEMVATNGDVLDFATTAVLTTAQLGATGWTVSNGIATKTGGTLAEFVTAFTAATTAGAVAFSDGTSTYVAYSDGTAATTTSDQIIELVGLTGATSVGTGTGPAVITIA